MFLLPCWSPRPFLKREQEEGKEDRRINFHTFPLHFTHSFCCTAGRLTNRLAQCEWTKLAAWQQTIAKNKSCSQLRWSSNQADSDQIRLHQTDWFQAFVLAYHTKGLSTILQCTMAGTETSGQNTLWKKELYWILAMPHFRTHCAFFVREQS